MFRNVMIPTMHLKQIAQPNRRTALLALAAFLSGGCASDNNFKLLGYQVGPVHDNHIRTIRVPIFKNRTYRLGLEDDLTRAVIKEIDAKTPYKVVGGGQSADTELEGIIISSGKNVINRNQLNEVREAETTVSVEIYWRDLRTGELLSQPKKKAPQLPSALDPTPVATAPDKPLLVTSTATFIPELGQSLNSSQLKSCEKLASQIVGMMENPW